jgi:hypothetical protein
MRQLGGTARLQAIKSQFAVGVNLTFPELKPHELQITLLSFRRSRLPNRHKAGIGRPTRTLRLANGNAGRNKRPPANGGSVGVSQGCY